MVGELPRKIKNDAKKSKWVESWTENNQSGLHVRKTKVYGPGGPKESTPAQKIKVGEWGSPKESKYSNLWFGE